MADDVTHVSQTTTMTMLLTMTTPGDETMTSQIPMTVLRFHYYWYYCFGPTSSSIVGFDDPFLQVVDLFGVTALYSLRVVFEMT